MVMSGLPYCTVVKPTFVEFLRQLRPGFAPLTVRQLHDEIDKIHLEVDAGVCTVSLRNVFFFLMSHSGSQCPCSSQVCVRGC